MHTQIGSEVQILYIETNKIDLNDLHKQNLNFHRIQFSCVVSFSCVCLLLHENWIAIYLIVSNILCIGLKCMQMRSGFLDMRRRSLICKRRLSSSLCCPQTKCKYYLIGRFTLNLSHTDIRCQPKLCKHNRNCFAERIIMLQTWKFRLHGSISCIHFRYFNRVLT